MNQRYVSIAATALAALIVAIGPATAQTPSNTGVNSRTDHPAYTGADDKSAVDSGVGNEAPPSASPRGDASKSVESDEQDMKDQQQRMEQIDRNSDRDLADNSK